MAYNKLKNRHKGVIWGVYLQDAYRGGGRGKALMVELLERAKKMPGLAQIQLTVTKSNSGAVNLYKKQGFEVYGEEKDSLRIGDVSHDELLMALPIKAQTPIQ